MKYCHVFDSSRTCDFCGIPAERVGGDRPAESYECPVRAKQARDAFRRTLEDRAEYEAANGIRDLVINAFSEVWIDAQTRLLLDTLRRRPGTENLADAAKLAIYTFGGLVDGLNNDRAKIEIDRVRYFRALRIRETLADPNRRRRAVAEFPLMVAKMADDLLKVINAIEAGNLRDGVGGANEAAEYLERKISDAFESCFGQSLLDVLNAGGDLLAAAETFRPTPSPADVDGEAAAAAAAGFQPVAEWGVVGPHQTPGGFKSRPRTGSPRTGEDGPNHPTNEDR